MRTYFKSKPAKRVSKSKVWADVRTQLLREMHERGQAEVCEICSGTFGLGFAHRVKRRKMPSYAKDPDAHRLELRMAAYLCSECHLKLEHGDPGLMFHKITTIVDNRNM